MTSKAKFHARYPLGMIEGNKNKVFTKRGKQLTIKHSKVNKSRYVTYGSYKRVQHINVDKLYFELFLRKKREVQEQNVLGCTDFKMKSVLRYETQKGYQAPLKGRDNLISVSGFFLRGKNKGKKVSELSTKALKWYMDNVDLRNNELIVMREELNKRK